MSYGYLIKKIQKHIVHRLSIKFNSFIPLLKQPIQQMFKLSSLCTNTRQHMLSPLTDNSVNNTLLQTTPNINQLLPEFVDIVDLHLVQSYERCL